MTVLVTGGAGYIGSHMVWALLERGEAVVVVDNLSTGSRGLVAEGAAFVEGNAGDMALIGRLIAEHGVDAIIHFAGSIVVPESVADPLAYYANNTGVAREPDRSRGQFGREEFHLFLDGHGLCRGLPRSAQRNAADRPHQPLWPLQADDGMDAGGHLQGP